MSDPEHQLKDVPYYKDCSEHRGFHRDMKHSACPWCVAERIMALYEQSVGKILAPLFRKVLR